MALRAVIFDLDGTLADTLPLCIEALSRTFRDNKGYTALPEEITRYFGLCDLGILARILDIDYDSAELPREQLAHYYKELHPQMCPSTFSGVLEMLQTLKESGLRLALISGRSEFTGRLSLEYLGLLPYFEGFGFGDPHYISKKARIAELLEQWQLSPQEALYVGDAALDIQVCKELKVPIINAAWAPNCHGSDEECLALCPEYRLDKLSELVPTIESLRN